MAVSEDHIPKRNLSEQSLQDLDTNSVTKQGAIELLTDIKAGEELVQRLNENDKKPDDLLSPTERSDFTKIVKNYKAAKSASEMKQMEVRARQVEVGLGIPQHGIMDGLNTLVEMDVKLVQTRVRIQDVQDRINVVNHDLEQLRSQQRNERIDFEKEMASMREEKTRQRLLFEEEIRTLKQTISRLEEEKQSLEKQIKDLKVKMEEEKAINERNRQEQRDLLEQLSQTNIKEIGKLRTEQDEKFEVLKKTHVSEMQKMKSNVDQLMEENRKLKTRDPYKLVAYGATLITNALYKHVHSGTGPRKNYYSIDALEHRLAEGYEGDEEGRRSAEGRWIEIKTAIGWNNNAKALLNQLAENRERGTRNINITVNYPEFSEAVRIMFDDNELEDEEMELIRDLFLRCNDKLPMQTTPRN